MLFQFNDFALKIFIIWFKRSDFFFEEFLVGFLEGLHGGTGFAFFLKFIDVIVESSDLIFCPGDGFLQSKNMVWCSIE